jgi:hypothetical protein
MAILPAQEPCSHAQEKSGNGAPFSLVRFFWASKRNEQKNKLLFLLSHGKWHKTAEAWL